MLARVFSRRALLSAMSVAFVTPAAAAAAGHPAQHDCVVVDPTADDVSSALIQAICAHCAAYCELRQIARRTDDVVIGRPVTREEFRCLDEASDLEERLLLAICEYPAANDAECHDKSTYLLGVFEGDERDPDLVMAILRSMTRGAARRTEP